MNTDLCTTNIKKFYDFHEINLRKVKNKLYLSLQRPLYYEAVHTFLGEKGLGLLSRSVPSAWLNTLIVR